jgi:CheY-specific phosphatase CheX
MRPAKELLERIVGGVLEDAAFVFATPRKSPAREIAGTHAMSVRQEFWGSLTGHCEIRAPLDLAMTLAANMLGMTDACADAQEICADALKEVLNIICGSLLTTMAGEDPVFRLGTPETRCGTALSPPDDRTSQVWLDAEGHPILFRIRIEDCASDAA